MSDKSCYGWNNVQTWTAALWLYSDRSSYRYWRGRAMWHRVHAGGARQVRDGTWSIDDAARYRLADQLQEELTDAAPLAVGMYAELLRSALAQVQWDEIAGRLLAEI